MSSYGAKRISDALAEIEPPNVYQAQWCCENEECVVREVVLHIKDQDEELVIPHAENDFCCPKCRQKLNFHGMKR